MIQKKICLRGTQDLSTALIYKKLQSKIEIKWLISWDPYSPYSDNMHLATCYQNHYYKLHSSWSTKYRDGVNQSNSTRKINILINVVKVFHFQHKYWNRMNSLLSYNWSRTAFQIIISVILRKCADSNNNSAQ